MAQFKQGNPGRPLGAIQKQPKRENLIKLCEYILGDLYENKEALTTNDKIRILTVYKGLFEDSTQNETTAERNITVTIVNSNEDETAA